MQRVEATFRSTQSPYSGAAPTKLVNEKLVPDGLARDAATAYEKDQVLSHALSEYCRLKDEGATPQIEEFCRRFPTYHKSIQRMIDVEETLDKMDDFDDVTWPDVGTSFMGFDVIRELGVGAFARVYLASEPALGGRLVAVKVSLYGSDEAETLGKLVHPNVVPVHSMRDDPESGMTAVCMPYLGSATLSDVIEQVFVEGIPRAGSTILEAVQRREVVAKQEAASPADEPHKNLRRGTYVDAVVRLGIQMAEALVYTHGHGVLHRDLKPSNVLITPAGQPKLLDFNLSCDVATEVNRLGGTLPYMPPEQINDVFLRPFEAKPPTDPRSDIFSLGVILYELVTGELPFGNPPSQIAPTDAGSIYLQAQQAPPRPMRELNPAIEPQTAQLIERCMAPDPDCRPANAEVVVAELSNHFAPARRLRRWSKAHKRILVAASAVVFALLLSLAYHLATRPPADRRLYNSGLSAMERGDYFVAIGYLDRAHEMNQDQPEIHLARGLCEQARNNHPIALGDFEPYAEGDCESIVKEVLAYAYFEAGRNASASRIYAELVARHPDDIKLKLNLAYANYSLLGQYPHLSPSNALRQANEILRQDPTCQAAHHIRAMSTHRYLVNHRHGYLTDVLQDVETALAMGPSNFDLELRAMRLLAMITKNDPGLQEDFTAEIKSRLRRSAPHFERKTLEKVAASLISIDDEHWFDTVKARCRMAPHPELMPHIASAPSKEAIQQHLRRAWK